MVAQAQISSINFFLISPSYPQFVTMDSHQISILKFIFYRQVQAFLVCFRYLHQHYLFIRFSKLLQCEGALYTFEGHSYYTAIYIQPPVCRRVNIRRKRTVYPEGQMPVLFVCRYIFLAFSPAYFKTLILMQICLTN